MSTHRHTPFQKGRKEGTDRQTNRKERIQDGVVSYAVGNEWLRFGQGTQGAS